MKNLINRIRSAGKLDKRIMLVATLSIFAVLHTLILDRTPSLPIDEIIKLSDAPVEHFLLFEDVSNILRNIMKVEQ